MTQTRRRRHKFGGRPLESTLAPAAAIILIWFATLASVQAQQQILATESTSCQLPLTWAGKWHQANKDPIQITHTEISDKGVCRDQKGDKYLFEFSGPSKQPLAVGGGGVASAAAASTTISGPCLVCLVINERHLNVLQYKESACQPIPASFYNRTRNQLLIDQDHSLLDSICADINGDNQLESLFRSDTPSIECPISGRYSFAYDNCKEPLSTLDSCIDKKQLNFKYSACPDVPGSESKSEVLKCYADWSEGNNYYMIGRLEYASNQQDRNKFRCFIYEKSPDGKIIQMAQSLEESCYGLINANEGPKTFKMIHRERSQHKCHFPSYVHSQSENWLSVDNSLIYMFNQNSTKYQVKETKEGNVIEEATCLQQFTFPQQQQQPPPHHLQHPHAHHHQARSSANQQQVIPSRRYMPSNHPEQQQQQSSRSATTNDVVYLVQITKNCHTTNFCVRFYSRSNGIVQLDYFPSSPNSENPCRNALIGNPSTQIITSTNLEHQRCPFEGAYTIEATSESDLTYNPSNIFICPRQSYLMAQCDHPSRLRVHSRCSPSKTFLKNLYCLGSWTTNGFVRLLLADDERQRYSAWYRDYGSISVFANQQQQQQQPPDGSLELPQASAWQQQQSQPRLQSPVTRSQQLLSNANLAPMSQQQQYLMNSLAPIVDLQIAMITPSPVIAKPTQVRLTRRSHCSELLNNNNNRQGASHSPHGSMSSMTGYWSAQSEGANSSGTSSLISSTSSILISIFVTLLWPHLQPRL